MTEFPHSPDEIIDPRWQRYLHANEPAQPSSRGRVKPAHRATDAELNAEIAAVLEPWRTGRAGPRETLEALRALADRLL